MSTAAVSPPSRGPRGPWPGCLCGTTRRSCCGWQRYDIAQNRASAFCGSMSSSTAMIHLPAKRCRVEAPDHARFARRHLADEGREDRIPPPRDRGDVHEGIVFLQIDVAVRLTERRLG